MYDCCVCNNLYQYQINENYILDAYLYMSSMSWSSFHIQRSNLYSGINLVSSSSKVKVCQCFILINIKVYAFTVLMVCIKQSQFKITNNNSNNIYTWVRMICVSVKYPSLITNCSEAKHVILVHAETFDTKIPEELKTSKRF